MVGLLGFVMLLFRGYGVLVCALGLDDRHNVVRNSELRMEGVDGMLM